MLSCFYHFKYTTPDSPSLGHCLSEMQNPRSFGIFKAPSSLSHPPISFLLVSSNQ